MAADSLIGEGLVDSPYVELEKKYVKLRAEAELD